MISLKLQNKAFLHKCLILSCVKVYYRVEESSDESIEESNIVVSIGVIEKDNTNAVDRVVEIEETAVVEKDDDDDGPALVKGL